MTVETLCTRTKELKEKFPILRGRIFVESIEENLSRIVTSANMLTLVNAERLEEAQRSERERYAALPEKVRSMASEQNTHDKTIERINMEEITAVLKSQCDFVRGVKFLYGSYLEISVS